MRDKTVKMTLDPALSIGFTGNRKLDDESRAKTRIGAVLASEHEAFKGLVYGVSSAASGGDLLFAETCLELSIPLYILLPMPRQRFRDDFDEVTWQRVEDVLARAALVEEMHEQSTREECYYDCGIRTVEESRLLLALWDGEPAQGMAGTAEMVAYARNTGRPVVYLHSRDDKQECFNEDKLKGLYNDAELEFLNKLPDGPPAQRVYSARARAEAWFEKLDRNASQMAPQTRRLSAIPIVLTAGAALASSFAAHSPFTTRLLLISAILGILYGVALRLLRLRKKQMLWARTRTAAEFCRSVMALWHSRGLYDVMGIQSLPQYASMLTVIPAL